MANNTELDAGSGGDTIRTVDKTTYKTGVTLIDVGGTGAESLIGAAGVGLPVKGLGTAGTANTGVVTVQGIASMTPILVTASAGTDLNTSTLAVESGGVLDDIATLLGGTLTVGTHAVSQSGTWDIGTVTAVTAITNALPAGSNAIGKLAANSGVDIGDVDVTSVPTDPFGANADAASATGSISAKLRFIAGTGIPVTGTVTVGSHAVTNAGTFAVQVDGNALTSLQLIDDTVYVDGVGFTPGSSKVLGIGLEADEASIGSVDEGDIGCPRMTLDRKIIVTQQPHTAGGLTTFMASGSDGSSILTNAAQVVKASAGQLYGYFISNPNAAVTFVHFYNTAAASVTVGTTNPLFTLQLPAASAANLMFPNGVLFSNAGWSIAATTTAGGNTAPSTGVDAVVWFM